MNHMSDRSSNAAAAALPAAADGNRCASDRCALKEVLGSTHVPPRLREALRART